MRATTSWSARLYGVLFHYLDLYESRLEAFVVPIEIILIAAGLVIALRRYLGFDEGKGAMAIESADIVVFVLLFGLLLSRYAVRVRGSRLGYAYERIVHRLQGSHDESAFRNFKEEILHVPFGVVPAHNVMAEGGSWRDRAHSYAGMIAGQTARLLSVRSWLYLDSRWQERERDALSEWFAEFPAALWTLPENPAEPLQGDPTKGGYYCSVIVPMTRPSARSIRKGERATDLAELDRTVLDRVAAYRQGGAGPDIKRVEFLAYVHIHVPKRNMRSVRDEMQLLAASIQHLAFLLHTLYGASEQSPSKWDFSILCESSNRHMNSILHRLGFDQLHRHSDGSKTQRQEARSYAGFSLFELRCDLGNGANARAKDFLGILWSVVCRYAEKGKAAEIASPEGSSEDCLSAHRDIAKIDRSRSEAVRIAGSSAPGTERDPAWQGDDG